MVLPGGLHQRRCHEHGDQEGKYHTPNILTLDVLAGFHTHMSIKYAVLNIII